MLREILDERLKTEFNDESKVKEDSIRQIRSSIEFVAREGTTTYGFSTENGNYEVTCSYKIDLCQGPVDSNDSSKEWEDHWRNRDYKIESLKLRE
ncbi:MAG: hypothetical protein E7310_03030 [Clostridiales bacterium]|nr:hypothetical protein [Clostridiales bacterium]